MGVITVNQLYKMLGDLKKKGFGDRQIWITSDDEGNEYHALFYGPTVDGGDIDDVYDMGLFHHDPGTRELVLLG